jgi:2-phospho-L-lactate/phosphoenolpyruvate guanylyltransferase
MQGTVGSFDTEQQHGWLLLDDGTRVEFPAAAFAASGLRRLRLGQRVTIEQSPAGEITRIALLTLP